MLSIVTALARPSERATLPNHPAGANGTHTWLRICGWYCPRKARICWSVWPRYPSHPGRFVRPIFLGGDTMKRFFGYQLYWYVGATLTLGLLGGGRADDSPRAFWPHRSKRYHLRRSVYAIGPNQLRGGPIHATPEGSQR